MSTALAASRFTRACRTPTRPREDRVWTRHASGVLARVQPASPEEEEVRAWAASLADGPWPPPGAIPVEVDDLYGEMAELGLEYGPAFACVRGAWRLGEELFCEVALGESEQAQAGWLRRSPRIVGCRAAGHGGAAERRCGTGAEEHGKGLRLPFVFNGVRLHSTGRRRVACESRSRGCRCDVDGGIRRARGACRVDALADAQGRGPGPVRAGSPRSCTVVVRDGLDRACGRPGELPLVRGALGCGWSACVRRNLARPSGMPRASGPGFSTRSDQQRKCRACCGSHRLWGDRWWYFVGVLVDAGGG